MTINELQKKAHANSVDKGFWSKEVPGEVPNISEKLMLIVTEVAEACECLRDASGVGMPEPGWLDDPEGQYQWDIKNMPDEAFESSVKDTFPDELADIIIRVGDLAEYLGYDLERHVKLKMEYNSRREKGHGKNF